MGVRGAGAGCLRVRDHGVVGLSSGEKRRRLGLDEKNKTQKKRNMSNQQLLNEQAHKLNKASY
jgi:hypothetical protein